MEMSTCWSFYCTCFCRMLVYLNVSWGTMLSPSADGFGALRQRRVGAEAKSADNFGGCSRFFSKSCGSVLVTVFLNLFLRLRLGKNVILDIAISTLPKLGIGRFWGRSQSCWWGVLGKFVKLSWQQACEWKMGIGHLYSFITFQNPFGGDEYLSASCFNVSMV